MPWRKPVHIVAAAALLAVGTAGLAGGASGPTSFVKGPAPQRVHDHYVPEPAGVRVTDWVTGLDCPWSLVFLPDGRALVSERGGHIRLIADGRLAPESVADLDPAHGIEGGLLGLAVDPRWPTARHIYAMMTVELPDGRVSRVLRFRLEGAHASFDRVIVDGIPAGRGHNGGRIAFGPDGMLYITTGDAYQHELSQDRSSLAGKILRVGPDGRPAPGNPRRDSPVYALGLRNPQGLAWHPLHGQLFASDHGPTGEAGVGAHDEINVIRRDGNYGWPRVVGAPGAPGFKDPLIAWTERSSPPSGMAFWRGDLYVATLGSEALARVEVARRGGEYRVVSIERWFHDAKPESSGRYGRLRDAVAGPDGALYVVTNQLDGGGDPARGDDRILRIEACPGLHPIGGSSRPGTRARDKDCPGGI